MLIIRSWLVYGVSCGTRDECEAACHAAIARGGDDRDRH